MDNLPQEILIEIFNFLDFDSLFDLDLTCRSWNKLLIKDIIWLNKSKEKNFSKRNISRFCELEAKKCKKPSYMILKRVLFQISSNEIEDPPLSLILHDNTITWEHSFDILEKLYSVKPVIYDYDIFFTEVTILNLPENSVFSFGIVKTVNDENDRIGSLQGGTGYHSDGNILDGYTSHIFESFTKGDVVGVGIHFQKNIIFFTKNNQYFEMDHNYKDFQSSYIEYDIEKDVSFKVNYGNEDFTFDLRNLEI